MKKLLTLTLITFISITLISQSCLPEGIEFTTQEQVDNFQTDYPGCTEIEGDVSIIGAEIQNLMGLENLVAIWGTLSIHNQSLLNLDGLDNLTYVGSNIYIDNTNLTRLSGLNELIAIGGDLIIQGNYNLADLTGLEGLTHIDGMFAVFSNDLIMDLTGLDNLHSIGGKVDLSGNISMVSLSGLNNLVSINGGLMIGRNYDYGSTPNQSLTSLSGLESLNFLGGGLALLGNPVLINLNALSNLKMICGNIRIEENNSLVALSGLNNETLTILSDMYIWGNPNLSQCDAISICNYLFSPNGSVNIYNNSEGCNSPAEIALECGYDLPCLPYGNYYFLEQEDIDNFPQNFPNCVELTGNVRIRGSNISNLEGLSVVTSIGSDLNFYDNDSLPNLIGLDNLTFIGGNLNIGGSQYPLGGNQSLINLNGLNSLTTIEGNLSIARNSSLINLSGLENLSSLDGSLIIGGYYAGNGSLSDISALSNLTSIGALWLGGIYSGNALTGLEGLHNITSIEGGLTIMRNDSLVTLAALSNLTHASRIEIRGNSLLSSLTGLENLNPDSINRFQVVSNITLSACHVQSMCEYLEMYDDLDHIYIVNNAPGCNSQEEVRDSCELVTINETLLIVGDITTSPNPFTTSTTLSYELQQPEKVFLSIYNHLGQLVCQTQENQPQGIQQLIWNAEGHSDGIYYYRLQVGDAVANGKMVKVR